MKISSGKEKKHRGRPPGIKFPREGLSDNEATVLKGLCLEPWAIDRELAKALGLKMSTVTAIKNRLKRRKAYRKANIPAYNRLGYMLLSTSMTRMDIGDADVQGGLPGTAAVFSIRDPLGCLVLALHRGYEEYRAFADRLDGLAGNGDRTRGPHGPWHHDIFVLRNGSRVAEFDFTNAVGRAFHLDGFDGHPPVRLDEELYVTRKKIVPNVLRALVAKPEAVAKALVKTTGHTRQSITKTMHMLRREGIIDRATLVELKTIGMELVAVTWFKFAKDGAKEKDDKAINDIEHIMMPFWYFVLGEDHVLLSCHANYDQYMGTMAEVSRMRGVAGLRTKVFGLRGGEPRYSFEITE